VYHYNKSMKGVSSGVKQRRKKKSVQFGWALLRS